MRWLTRALSPSIITIVVNKGSSSRNPAHIKKRQSPENKTDLHQNRKNKPTEQPYLQIQGQVTANEQFFKSSLIKNTVKPLGSGHQLILKNLSVIERCPLSGGNFKKICPLFIAFPLSGMSPIGRFHCILILFYNSFHVH